MKYTMLRANLGGREQITLVQSEILEEENVNPSDFFVGSPVTQTLGEVNIDSDDPSVLNMLPEVLTDDDY